MRTLHSHQSLSFDHDHAVEMNQQFAAPAEDGTPGAGHDWLCRLFAEPTRNLDILEAVAEGIVIVDERRNILFANHHAREVVRSGGQLQFRNERLDTAPARSREELQAFLRQCGEPASAGRCLRLGDSRADGYIWLRVLRHLPARGGDPALTVLALGSSLGGIFLRGPSLRHFFAMTEAEASVALELAAGRTAAWIAQKRGVSVNTVRTQVRIVLRKAGADRIADLVRMVANLPPSPDGNGA